jgi:hypothetical protein
MRHLLVAAAAAISLAVTVPVVAQTRDDSPRSQPAPAQAGEPIQPDKTTQPPATAHRVGSSEDSTPGSAAQRQAAKNPSTVGMPNPEQP